MVRRGREKEDESDGRADERREVDVALGPRSRSSNWAREADREQEAEEDIRARDERAQLLEKLVVLALEPRLERFRALGFEHLALELVGVRRRHAGVATPIARRNAAAWPRAFASRSPSSSRAPIRSRSSSSSRRCVRIISGPSVAIVNGTSCSANVRNDVTHGVLVGQRLREEVRRRADLERDPEVADRRHEARVLRGEDAVPDAIGPEVLDDVADLVAPHVAALFADVDGHAEPGVAGGLDDRLDLRVVVAAASGARAGDVDADDSAPGPADRLLDDDLVEPQVEGAIHHQDEPGADLRVLDARAIDASDRREDDVVEVALAAAVPLHRVEAQLERRDPLRAVRAADRAVHRALDCERRGLDELRPVVDLVELVETLHAVRDPRR